MITVRGLDGGDIVPLGDLVLSSIDHAPSSVRTARDLPTSPLLVGEDVTMHLEGALTPLVAELDGDLAGLITFVRRSMKRSSHVVVVELLVHPNARGRGIGGMLLERGCAQAWSSETIGKLVMTTAADDPGLERLLERTARWRREQVFQGALRRGNDRVSQHWWGCLRAPHGLSPTEPRA